MTHKTIDVPTGNYYDKYNSGNPIVKKLMKGFITDFSDLVSLSGASNAFEVGCGEGYLSLKLFEAGLNVSGCDLDPDMAQQAQTRIASAGFESKFFGSDIYELDTCEIKAELVVCCEVLEHVGDPLKALEILAQISTDYVLLSVPREPIWRVLNMARLRYLGDLGNTPGHIQHWSSSAFCEFVKQCFDIIEVRAPTPWTMVLARRRL